MKWYVAAIVTICALEGIGKLYELAYGPIERTKFARLCDVLTCVLLIVWGTVLLCA